MCTCLFLLFFFLNCFRGCKIRRWNGTGRDFRWKREKGKKGRGEASMYSARVIPDGKMLSRASFGGGSG